MLTRKSVRVIACLSAAVLLLASVAVGPVVGREPDARYYARVDARIRVLERAGATDAQVDAMLKSEFGWTRAGILKPAAQTTSVEAAAVFNPSSSNVRLKPPTTYWNGTLTRHEVRGTWQWNDCSAYERCWAWYPGNLGEGQNGFGISFSRPTTHLSTSLNVYDEKGRARTYSSPDSFGQYGATFAEFDIHNTYPTGYSWDHGTIFMSLRLPSSSCVRGQALTISTRMGHTWNGTGVSSITVGSSGISVTFSSTSYRWTGVLNPAYYWYPCGV